MRDATSVMIIEDDPLSAVQLKNWIEKIDEFQLIALATNGAQALEMINLHNPEVIFSDIELPDMDAFEILEKIPASKKPYIVFTTAHNEHAIKAFDISALDYLLKPFDEERFQFTVKKIIDLKNSAEKEWSPDLKIMLAEIQKNMQQANPLAKTMPIKVGGKIHFIEIETIEFVKASSYYIEIYAGGKKYLIRESMADILTKLPASHFIRIHRGAIINLKYIKEIEKINQNDYQVILKNNLTHRISKSYRKDVFEKCQVG